MSKVKLYRDTRDGVICLRFSHKSTHSDRRTPVIVSAEEWNGNEVTNRKDAKQLNTSLDSMLASCRAELMHVEMSRQTFNLTAADLRDLVCGTVFNDDPKKPKEDFFSVFDRFIHMRTHSVGTQRVYLTTYNMVHQYDPTASFNTITTAWLHRFTDWMTETGKSANYRSIQQRNIRAVFNYAIDEGITDKYPFRAFSIDHEDIESRDLSVAQIRALFSFCGTFAQERYVDIFKLQFCLLGANIADLFSLRPEDYHGGRIHYRRKKTGRLYNIKVEPEAAAIIEKYKGSKDHLLNFFDQNYSGKWAWFLNNYNRHLRQIGEQLHIRFKLTSYVSRYSWASIAYNELDIPMEVISQALGHSFGLKVTQGYIHVNPKRVDDANRKVLDYLKG